jgi:plastin-1
LADLNLKKTPQLVELFDDSRVTTGILSFHIICPAYFLRKKHFVVYCSGYRRGFELITGKDVT